MLCRLQLKLKRKQQQASEPPFDSGKLNDITVRRDFAIELSNKFQVLDSIPVDDINTLCTNIQKAFTDTSKEILGPKRRQRKEWISDTTWQLIEERKAAKLDMLRGTEEERQLAAEVYRDVNIKVKKKCEEGQEAIC